MELSQRPFVREECMSLSVNFSCRPVANKAARLTLGSSPDGDFLSPCDSPKGERCDLEAGREGSAVVVGVSYRGFLGIPTR